MATLQKVEIYGVRHAYIEYANAGVLSFKRVWFTKDCEVKTAAGKLEFAGDGQKYEKFYGMQVSGTIAAELDDNQLDSILWAMTSATPGVGDDWTVRYYHGTYSEMQTNYVGLRITLDAGDVDTGAPLVVRYRVPKCQFAPDTPPKFATESVIGRMLEWSARKATTDITGAALTGMPATGAFWFKEIVSNTADFDPVAGDNL